jgi:hypothetical protein
VGLSLKRAPRFQPRRPRYAANLSADLLLPDGREVVLRIRNLSDEGFMGEAAAGIEPDTWLGVSFPGFGILRAQVRWADGHYIGGWFAHRLDLDKLGA